MEKDEIMSMAMDEAAKITPKAKKVMEDRIVSSSLEKFLNGEINNDSGEKVKLIDLITQKVLMRTLENGSVKDLKAIAEMLGELEKKSSSLNVNVKTNATDLSLSELAKGNKKK